MVRSVKFSKLLYLKALHGADLTSSEYRILVTILCYTDANGEGAYPGPGRLSGDCNMSERTVKRCIKSLRIEGYLRRTKKGGRNPRRASEYALSLPAWRAQWWREQTVTPVSHHTDPI